jgi:hypothetical protein
MESNRRKTMKKKEELNLTIFFISGLLLMTVISAIKFANNAEFGIWSSVFTFIYGGLVGQLATTKHTSFLKNLSFGGVVFFVVWTALNPVQTAGNIVSFKSTQIQVIILLVIIFLEEEILNTFRRMRKAPTSYAPGFFGIFALLIILSKIGVLGYITDIIFKIWQVGIIVLLLWWGFLLNSGVKGLDNLASRLKKWGK